ncbi:MAG: ACT domain-containing protein [Aeromicrobium sp.]
MAFLLRVELPDVPGSLGALATALGSAGADIEAIEIVEHRSDGVAVDDVLLEIPPSVMPDKLITACHKLDGVRVHWISRYNAGANLSMDLEAVERFTEDPAEAIAQLVEVIPATFRTDWAMAIHKVDGEPAILNKSATAPKLVDDAASWMGIRKAKVLADVAGWDSMVLAAVPFKDRSGKAFVMVVGRHGGPEFLKSELARLAHMTGLAASVQIVQAISSSL